MTHVWAPVTLATATTCAGTSARTGGQGSSVRPPRHSEQIVFLSSTCSAAGEHKLHHSEIQKRKSAESCAGMVRFKVAGIPSQRRKGSRPGWVPDGDVQVANPRKSCGPQPRFSTWTKQAHGNCSARDPARFSPRRLPAAPKREVTWPQFSTSQSLLQDRPKLPSVCHPPELAAIIGELWVSQHRRRVEEQARSTSAVLEAPSPVRGSVALPAETVSVIS